MPAPGSSGHWRAQRLLPASTGGHESNGSVGKEWDFVSKGMGLCLKRHGKFVIEHFTPITLGRQKQDAVSDEDVAEIWKTLREEAISKVKKAKGRGGDFGGPECSSGGARMPLVAGQRSVREREC